MTIAGSDSGGGAGIQADLKTFQKLGVYGTSVITAVTAQNTLGVHAWEPVAPLLVERQIDAVMEDLRPAATKSGMLGSLPVVEAVIRGLERYQPKNFVLDPVMVSSSGDRLLDEDAEGQVIARLLPLTRLVTPNLAEAEALTGRQVRTPEQMEAAGEDLIRRGAGAALITGGHLEGDEIVDVLVLPRAQGRQFRHQRRATTSTHGTGCVLSAAITAGLANERPLDEAVFDAVEFVQRALAAAPGLGRGAGPLGI